MGGPYCETCKHGYFPVAGTIHGECSDPTKQIHTGGHSSSCPDITRRSECQNHTGLTVQAAPSDRENRLEDALLEIASHGRDKFDRDIARAALADTTTGEVQP